MRDIPCHAHPQVNQSLRKKVLHNIHGVGPKDMARGQFRNTFSITCGTVSGNVKRLTKIPKRSEAFTNRSGSQHALC